MHPGIRHLPDHLSERARSAGAAALGSGGIVLYWMRTALRGHDNAALDAALTLADALDRPLFVYHGLGASEPYASDRVHRFILESARDVAGEFADAGIAYGFHLERPGDDGPALQTLAERAAVVVTEDMPTPPFRLGVRALADDRGAPVLLVDTACTLPMRLVAKRPERAFAFRKATERARMERLALPWPPYAGRLVTAVPDDLPFTPIDLETADLSALIAECAVDHMVGPVADTPGGARAGYARWTAFREQGLRTYARRRNDALDRQGVSRMSPYLHFGCVSPFQIAREALEVGGPGAEKFLDELLIWRELAHAWCHHTPEIETLDALPGWARASLDAHRRDRRDQVFDGETLARGRTGDALWDAAQTSLVVHGELHNNLRMTWGKALPHWTETPEDALRLLVDLNHRYALDGRDPNSYGGLFWCLGLFDRPFEPPSPVTGTLRPRPTAQHAKRLDVEAYARRVASANATRPPRVAVVGAGLAGLVCARTLKDHGLEVVVFDKSRGVGGRMATRRTDTARFDHGAQYVTARDERFVRYVEAWAAQGLLAPWQPDGREQAGGTDIWWVATPGMSALGRHLAGDVEVRGEITVARLEADGRGWRVVAGDGVEHGTFDMTVVATPAPQAIPLLAPVPELAEAASRAVMAPSWAALLELAEPIGGPEVLRPAEGPLAWAALDASKPGREGARTWVLHGRPGWSRANLERDADAVLADLAEAFAALVGRPLPEALYARAHRWRYALVETPVGVPCLFDGAAGLAACGDWCVGGRVEAAFLSGAAAAGRILNAVVDRERREAV